MQQQRLAALRHERLFTPFQIYNPANDKHSHIKNDGDQDNEDYLDDDDDDS